MVLSIRLGLGTVLMYGFEDDQICFEEGAEQVDPLASGSEKIRPSLFGCDECVFYRISVSCQSSQSVVPGRSRSAGGRWPLLGAVQQML